MLRRRTILLLSFLVASIAHLVFFIAAPQVSLMRTFTTPQDLYEVFQLKLGPPADVSARPSSPEEMVVASRPGAVEDLVKRADETLAPDLAAPLPAEVPGLEQRVTADALTPPNELPRSDALMKRVDAKILEIAQEDARRNLEVPRRLVRPSPQRLLTEADFPSLRSNLGTDEGRLDLGIPTRSLLAESMASGDVRAPVTLDEPGAANLLLAPVEHSAQPAAEPPAEIASLPAAREVEKARRESGYVFMDDLVDIHIESYAPPGETHGYFRLRILPREDAQLDILPKDVTFVVDASNSIPQYKLNVTTEGIVRALRQLRPEDTFNIVVFRDTPEFYQPQPLPATRENLAPVERFLEDLPSRGQTNVYEGILPVLQRPPRPGVANIVLIATDGRPTTGLQDARAIINGLTADNRLGHTLYAFGGGNTVNRYLLDLLAYRNKGEALVTDTVESIDEGLPKFFGKLADPLLVNLQADYGGIESPDIVPKLLPDFYRGQVVTLYGRFPVGATKEIVMRLSGDALDKKKELVFRATLAEATTGDREIARNWGFQKSYDIIGEISRAGETPELVGELRGLAQKFNIRTAYTE